MKNIKEVVETHKFRNRVGLHLMMEDFLVLDEGTPDPEVLDMLKKGDFESDAKAFKDSLSKSKHQEMLADYSVAELKKMKLFKLPGLNIGFALKKKDGKHQDIVAVHNNEPNVRGIGTELMKSAIANGGKYLDHFDIPALTKLYTSLGFQEYDRDEFDPQYDEGGKFEAKYGKLPIIYRKLK
jgi:hypothetical protein